MVPLTESPSTGSSPVRPVTVLYIAGSGRSGSTVITTILGQLPECFAAGELRYLWQRGVELDHLCGCGALFSQCPVWTSVMAQVRSVAPGVDETGVGRRLLHRLRIARLPSMAVRRLLGRPPVPPHADDDVIAALYRAVADRTGAPVVVDSSKLPPYGMLLSQLPGIDLRVLQVVRDPRAAAFSWRRTRESRDRPEGSLMQRQETWKSSVLWLIWNLVAATAWRTGDPRVMRVRYEDFVAAPLATMERVAVHVGADPAGLPFVTDDSVTLAPTHSVAGNPNRHDTGAVRLRADVEWASAMPVHQRILVTGLTAAGLLRFGYPLRTSSIPDGATKPRATNP